MGGDSQEPGLPEPLVRIADIATPLSKMITSAMVFTSEHKDKFGDDPVTGSRAQLEYAANMNSSEGRRVDIEWAHGTAGAIYIQSAGQLLSALTKLLSSEVELFAYQVVARSVVEYSAKAWWLVDAGASTDQRLARFYLDNLANLVEMATADRLPEAELAKGIDDLVKRAGKSGLNAILTKRGDVNGFEEVTKIGSTTLVGRFFQAIGYESGALWYRRFSAVIHGTPYGLLDFYQMRSAAGSDYGSFEPTLPIEAIREAAIISTQAYLGAIEYDCRHSGRNGERIAEYRQQLFQRMSSLMPDDLEE